MPADYRVTVTDLLRHADQAMYVAKRTGKNAFVVHSRRRVEGAEQPPAQFVPAAHQAELDQILEHAAITAVFQPIVEIESGERIGYEALSRGPEGSALERPDHLFAAAAAANRLSELDWLCRVTAVEAALEAGLGKEQSLFLNCEPSVFGQACPPQFEAVWERAKRELDLVLEITERALTDRPSELCEAVGDHRADGRRIALDDLGADVRSLALLPLLEPDVIKLDLRLVQDRPSTDQAAIVSAVAAERERTGAMLLAEGIETGNHVAIARSLGATLGQGWHWGKPERLAPLQVRSWSLRPIRRHLRAAPAPSEVSGAGRTPFEVISAARPTADATKALLLPMSHLLESRALQIGEGAVILSAFQHARHFTPATARRYETLARSASLCAAFAADLSAEPATGVRGGSFDADSPLCGEWSVLVIGPHFAGALVAQDLGDEAQEADRRFVFATAYDRTLVISAARTLLKLIRARDPHGLAA